MVETPVLISGGGPVGLALAGDLGWRGTPCVLIEQSDGTIVQPKMDMVGVRSMEFCRRWGIADEVEACPYPRDYPQDNIYLTSLTGFELGRERFPSMGSQRPSPQSPQMRYRAPQNMFDPILARFASRFPHVQLRYRMKLVGLEERGDHVLARVENLATGATASIAARYLVGCDGAGSLVREARGIRLEGQPVLTYTTNIIFRCPNLVALHNKGRAYRHIFVGPEGTWATLVAINGRDQWRFSLIGSPTPKVWSEDEIRGAIRRAIGRDCDYEILSIMPWTRRELVAENYGGGRVLLAGDSAHMMSPTGGFGMNTGIGDAVGLSWKLTALLQGWGGAGLIDAYTFERKPVAVRNMTEASGNLGRMLSAGHNPTLLDYTEEGERTRARVGKELWAAMHREWHTIGIHLGYRYEDSTIVWADGTPAPPYETMSYEPNARPGARAPHVWLRERRSTLDPSTRASTLGDPSTRASTLDLFGRTFTLLRLGADAPDAAPLVSAAARLGMPLEVVPIDAPEVVTAVLDVYERKLVLVRPDGHVAWRADGFDPDPAHLIDVVRGARDRADATG